ncbi:MAG: LPS export ABC transporter permease LptG [Hyphomonadaceae bacterium]
MIGARFLQARLGRYLATETIFGVGVTLACVAATVLLVDVVEQLRSFGGRQQLALISAIYLTMLKTPQLIEQTLPFVVLMGAMIAMVRLNRRSELIAIRAAGVSAWRFLAPTAAVAFTIGVFAMLALNPVAARLYEEFEHQTATFAGGAPQEGANIWLRQGDAGEQVVIHADAADQRTGRLHDVTLMFFSVRPNGALQFERRMAAKTADLRDGFWQLHDVAEAAPGTAVERHKELALPTTLRPAALLDRVVNPTTISFWELPRFIGEARRAGSSPLRYELRWQSLLALPLFVTAMATIGAVFSLRLQRLGGVGQMAAAGLAMGFLLYFTNQLISAFAISETLSPAIAAWAPPTAGLFGAMAVLSYAEDG